MGASGLEQKVAKLFEAAGYDVSQAVGLEAGAVDWFATPRAGLSRPKTYFVAWARCPEDLAGTLPELERARVARRADKALGVVMEGRLPERYKTDLGRVAEAITYRRLALEVSGCVDLVRDHVQKYERTLGPEYYLPLRGRVGNEIVDVVSHIKSWAEEDTAEDLGVWGPLHWGTEAAIEHAVYELGKAFLRDPENTVPLVRHSESIVSFSAFEDEFAIEVRDTFQGEPWRSLMTAEFLDFEVEEGLSAAGRLVNVLRPHSPEIEPWFARHISDGKSYDRLLSCRRTEPHFRWLSNGWANLRHLVGAIQRVPANPAFTNAEWVAHTVAYYMASFTAATKRECYEFETMALSQFAFGREAKSLDETEARHPFSSTVRTPTPPPVELATWTDVPKGEESGLNRLIRDYFLARKIIRDVAQGRLDILARYQFPKEYVLLFLSILSPEAAAQLSADRTAEMRAQMEVEVERRLQLTLAHLLKRSVGALRMNLDAIRDELPPDLEAKHRYELDRIDEELRFQSALAERTGRWQSVPNGPEEAVTVHEIVSAVLAPLGQKHPELRCHFDVGPDLHVRARPTVLREILHFLLENACHAAAFARSPDPWVRVAGRIDGETIVIEISDSGPGVPASDREHIFDPYFTTKKGGDQPLGTGLGLAMARDYAKHIGAEVGLDTSRPETCFFIRLVAWRDAS